MRGTAVGESGAQCCVGLLIQFLAAVAAAAPPCRAVCPPARSAYRKAPDGVGSPRIHFGGGGGGRVARLSGEFLHPSSTAPVTAHARRTRARSTPSCTHRQTVSPPCRRRRRAILGRFLSAGSLVGRAARPRLRGVFTPSDTGFLIAPISVHLPLPAFRSAVPRFTWPSVYTALDKQMLFDAPFFALPFFSTRLHMPFDCCCWSALFG